MTEKNEENYFEVDAMSSGQLQKFMTSPAHAAQKTKPKAIFGMGHCFEDMIRSGCTESKLFPDYYMICDIPGKIPDEILTEIEGNASIEKLKSMEKLTKKNERNLTYKNYHDWLDMAILRRENGYELKTMISEIDVNICKLMFRNFKDIMMLGVPIMDILSSGKARWQWPVYWEINGIKKKALFDCVLVDVQGFVIPIDFKTTASLSQFEKELKYGKWVQGVHYEEGARFEWGMPVYPMQFLVASKSKVDHYLSQPMEINEYSYPASREKYKILCDGYAEWDANGRHVYGALPKKKVNVWSNLQ